jgi:molybdopterin-guanine dinucleotide biosynthesis protein A
LDISCIILAGGQSLRLGRDKVLERFDDKSLLEQVISRIESLTRDVIVVTARERTLPQAASHPKMRTVSDIFAGGGSLGGIYTGLVTSNSFYNLVVACDMPFLSQSLLRYMIEIADGFDFVLPRVNSHYEPLHAVYSKNCLAGIETLLKEGRRVITELLDMVKVRYVEAEEVDRFDPQHLSFFNINTEADLEWARQFARGDEVL